MGDSFEFVPFFRGKYLFYNEYFALIGFFAIALIFLILMVCLFRLEDVIPSATVAGVALSPGMGKGATIGHSMVRTPSGMVTDREQQMQHGTSTWSWGCGAPCLWRS